MRHHIVLPDLTLVEWNLFSGSEKMCASIWEVKRWSTVLCGPVRFVSWCRPERSVSFRFGQIWMSERVFVARSVCLERDSNATSFDGCERE
ncbi:Pentatricopeptide repeat domain containing protein [Dorcoceras hygrometricum]|uniref:Pentatricopeptide repeat domain containing protein n=1 Tax=Dorcoceras hygrometricum TaxID=472368 RepID=A0A2Z7BJL8_9LAMI|nr:Pentatricopeptide repeat domain containing protein [Dorcoceras hygrometricum]